MTAQDGTDDALTDPHQCKLKELFINSWESTDLGEAQLCWLVRLLLPLLSREAEITPHSSLHRSARSSASKSPPRSVSLPQVSAPSARPSLPSAASPLPNSSSNSLRP